MLEHSTDEGDLEFNPLTSLSGWRWRAIDKYHDAEDGYK